MRPTSNHITHMITLHKHTEIYCVSYIMREIRQDRFFHLTINIPCSQEGSWDASFSGYKWDKQNCKLSWITTMNFDAILILFVSDIAGMYDEKIDSSTAISTLSNSIIHLNILIRDFLHDSCSGDSYRDTSSLGLLSMEKRHGTRCINLWNFSNMQDLFDVLLKIVHNLQYRVTCPYAILKLHVNFAPK